MKFTVPSKDLAKAMAMPAKMAARKSPIPALRCLLLNATASAAPSGDGILTITGGDGDAAVSTTAAAIRTAEGGGGTACIDAKLFSDAIKALPEQPITVTATDNEATIAYDGGEYHMPSYPDGEYPAMSEPADATSRTVHGAGEAIARAAAYAATGDKETLRPVLGAVCVSLSDDGAGGTSWEVCASDGASLFTCGRGPGHGQSPAPVLMPAHVAKMFTALTTDTLTFTIGERVTRVEGGGRSITFRAIESRYPNYHAVIPATKPAAMMDIKAQDIIPALRRALTFAPEGTSCVVISCHGGKAGITADDKDYAKAFREALPAEGVTADFTVGLDGQRLLDTMQMFAAWTPDGAPVRINFWTPDRAITITPLSAPDEGHTTALLMPMLI